MAQIGHTEEHLPRTWQATQLSIIPEFKMEEVQPDLSNGAGKEVGDADLTIPSNENETIVTKISSSGGIYKYGLTLEELFNLSLDYYKKGNPKNIHLIPTVLAYMRSYINPYTPVDSRKVS